MSATGLHDLSIAELSGLITTRKLSPVELVEALIQRVEQYDAQTRAFITRTFDLARHQARAAEAEIAAGKYRGALHGIPFALKDIYDTKGFLTSGHSRVFIDRIPGEDATTTSKLYDAGAVLLGKLATHEMAHAGPSFDLPWPPARNPWSLAHFTGGSSSGSGAAVAAGMVPLALGSDTGGSIRGPASLCGVVGLMPTFGLVSRAGVITNSYTFDHCGPLARTVDDCALALEALAGYDPKDAGSLSRPIPRYRRALGQDLRGLRIGVLRHHWEEDIPASEDVRTAMDAALDVLRRLGAELEECRVRPLASYFDVKIIIAESEIFSVHQKNLIARLKDFGADFRSRVLPSVLFTASDYVQATREHRRMMVEMEPLYPRFDAFVTAGMGEAPKLADYRSVSFWQKPSLLTAWNVTGQPVLALPNGFGRSGLPLGIQIVGRPFGETTILRIGHAYERATEWHTRRPPLVQGATAPDVTPPPVLSQPADQVDAETRDLCVKAARRAGLQLDELMLAQLLEGAPYALGMVRRLRRDHELHHEPANVFSFPSHMGGPEMVPQSPQRSERPRGTRGAPREGDDVNIRPNRVKEKLAAGQVATILSGANDPDLIDQLGTLDVDGIWLEGEHGGVDYADLGNLTRACDLWGKTSVVRVMDNDYATIYRTLDRGAQGICVPHVNTRAEAESVVAAGKFAPLGKRGMYTSRQGFGVGDYLKTANDQSLLIVLIEDIAAVRSLDEVVKVDHIDCFFVAPSDLATSMGQIGNPGHPEVQQTIDGAIKKIVQSGRVAGTLVNVTNVERYTRLGVRLVMTSFFPWIQAGAKDLIDRAAGGARS